MWRERIPSKYHTRRVCVTRGRGLIYEGANGHPDSGRRRQEPSEFSFGPSRTTRCARVLRLRRPGGRHEPGRRARFDVLSVLPALLRLGLQRGNGQGPRLALCAGLQRLDDRLMVRSCTRAVHPVDARPALGPHVGRGRGPRSRVGLARRLLLRKPGHTGLPTVHDREATGPFMAPARPTPWSACTSARRASDTMSDESPMLVTMSWSPRPPSWR